jgi:CTP synthase (UTP-ammonia lyase)
MRTSLAIIGDFNPANESHRATNRAIEHSAAALGWDVQCLWMGTEKLTSPEGLRQLSAFHGFWIAPASPYRSMGGALSAIRLAREQGVPLLGTCGGFQHIILEYARNFLGITDAEHEESSPGAPRLVISRLACSLAGRKLTIKLQTGSRVAALYGQPAVQERYYCSFGVSPEYVETLRTGPLRTVASDAEGVMRAVELVGHPFFVGTLFLPQLGSNPAAPHPLVSGFVRACSEIQKAGFCGEHEPVADSAREAVPAPTESV